MYVELVLLDVLDDDVFDIFAVFVGRSPRTADS